MLWSLYLRILVGFLFTAIGIDVFIDPPLSQQQKDDIEKLYHGKNPAIKRKKRWMFGLLMIPLAYIRNVMRNLSVSSSSFSDTLYLDDFFLSLVFVYLLVGVLCDAFIQNVRGTKFAVFILILLIVVFGTQALLDPSILSRAGEENNTSFDIHVTKDFVCVITTGQNDRVGLEAAKMLSKAGATVVTSSNANNFIDLDLNSFESIKSFADELKRRFKKIDLLILNDMEINLQFSKEKHQIRGGLSYMYRKYHLGHFYLTSQLLPLLENQEGRKSKVVVVSSYAGIYSAPVLTLEDIVSPAKQQGFENPILESFYDYGRTNLANALFAQELLKRHPSLEVYTVSPGIVRPEFSLSELVSKDVMSIAVEILSFPLGKRLSEAAKTLLNPAFSEKFKSGSFIVGFTEYAHLQSIRPELSNALWESSQKLST